MNDPKRIPLEVLGTARTAVEPTAFLVLLREVDSDRHLPIVVGQAEAQAIAAVVNHVDMPRPLTVDLFASLCRMGSMMPCEVVIHTLDNGVFFADILLKDNDDNTFSLDARPSDAIAIAIRMNVPIYTTEEILDTVGFRGQVRPLDADDDGDDALSPLERLQAELEQCVESEEYERAAEIQKKIAQLTGQTGQNH